MNNQQNSKHWLIDELKNILLITPGASILACGVAFFLLPAKIATGGTPGMAMVVHFLTSIPTGIAMLMINTPLLLIAFKFIDFKFVLRSVYSILISSLLVDLLKVHFSFPEIDSTLLSTIYGGTCVGAGVGLVLRGNASAGGTSIVAKIVSDTWHVKPAQVLFVLDITVVITIGFIFADMERALWSMLSIYASTQIMDKILTGAVSEKIVHIVSQQSEQLGQSISEELERDGTILSGQNLTTEHDKNLLFVVVGARRIPQLRNLVLNIDPGALMIVMEASEMMGSSRKY